MTTVETVMAVGYLVGVIAASGSPRGVMWLMMAGTVFLSSSLYWRAGLPHPELLAGSLDAMVCLAIYFFGRHRWEMWVWRLFQVMLLINIIHLAGSIGLFHDISRNAYGITLEVMNWLIILIVGGTSALQRAGYGNGGAFRPWRGLRGVLHSLCEKRRTPPFTEVR